MFWEQENQVPELSVGVTPGLAPMLWSVQNSGTYSILQHKQLLKSPGDCCVFRLVIDKSKQMRTEMNTLETSKSSIDGWAFEEWKLFARICLGFWLYNYPLRHQVGHSQNYTAEVGLIGTIRYLAKYLLIFDHFRLSYAQAGHVFVWYPCPFAPGAVPAMNLTGSRWKDLQETIPRREAMGQLSGESPEA